MLLSHTQTLVPSNTPPKHQPITASPASSVLKTLASSLALGEIPLLVSPGLVPRGGILRSMYDIAPLAFPPPYKEKSKGIESPHLLRNMYREFNSDAI